MIIKGKDFDDTFKKVCLILNDCPLQAPRGLKTKEIINSSYTIEDPFSCILTNPHRKISEKYLLAELKWYLSGDQSIKNIKEHATMWEKIANPDGTVNSNYGYYVWKQTWKGCSQFEWIINSLKKDSDTRQAVINFNQPFHKYEGNKDFVCTLSTQYFIRNNKLYCIVNMRSQDFVFGAGNDVPFFVYVQKEILEALKDTYPDLEMGSITTNCGSLHIYERHFNMLEKIVTDENPYISKTLFEVFGR